LRLIFLDFCIGVMYNIVGKYECTYQTIVFRNEHL